MKTLRAAACTIYHNPRCSKSRATLSLLQEQGVELTVVEYLKTPLAVSDIKTLLLSLSMEPHQLVRKSEGIYQELFAQRSPTPAQLVTAMAKHPELIERPIVVIGKRAVLGRPPENALQLLK